MSDDSLPGSKEELIQLIDRSWSEINGLLESIPDEKLAMPGPEGWSVKDHLAHMGAWERIAVAGVKGESEEAAAGVDPWEGEWDTDRFNDLLYRRHAGMSAPEARRYFQESHAGMMSLIGQLDDSTLRADMPNEPGRPNIDKIVGNTYPHFDEHRAWIQSLLASL